MVLVNRLTRRRIRVKLRKAINGHQVCFSTGERTFLSDAATEKLLSGATVHLYIGKNVYQYSIEMVEREEVSTASTAKGEAAQ